MGIVPSFVNEGFPAKSHFSTNDIPDLTGKVIIVTGANGGEWLLFGNSDHICIGADVKLNLSRNWKGDCESEYQPWLFIIFGLNLIAGAPG